MRLDQAAVVDLYSGVGGMTRGFRDEGLRVVAGVDIDPSCRFPYETNNPGSAFVAADLSKAHAVDIGSLFPKDSVRVLIGCAPCQPFSRYSNTRRSSDDKWRLLYAFSRVIRATHPVVVSMENVPDLARHRVFRDFLASLDREGYFVGWGVVDAADYGVPQTRRRLVLLASALGPIELVPAPRRQKRRTVRDAIGHLDQSTLERQAPKDRLHPLKRLDWPQHPTHPVPRRRRMARLARQIETGVPSKRERGIVPKRLWANALGRACADADDPVPRVRKWAIRPSRSGSRHFIAGGRIAADVPGRLSLRPADAPIESAQSPATLETQFRSAWHARSHEASSCIWRIVDMRMCPCAPRSAPTSRHSCDNQRRH